MSKELKCSYYRMYEPEDEGWSQPVSCPVCGGFLAWNDGEPKCNKCGAELLVIPDREDGEELETGKVCPISLGKIEAHTRASLDS